MKRILIANRGEIAKRIIYAARQLGYETVLVYSTEDVSSLPVSLADKSVCIGPPVANKSYMNQESIIQTALSYGCDAIHPGYGFLSENAEFAKKCEDKRIIFIGPNSSVIKKMGDKQSARKLARDSGVPTVPGSENIVTDIHEAKKTAEEIGYPILLKAAAGGGGKGMRAVNSEEEMETAFAEAAAESRLAFDSDDIYIEKLIERPRHIEVQILGDNHGNIVSVGERDCSLQRRHQKIIEESPASLLPESIRKKIQKDALAVAEAAGYNSAGTVEFILDEHGKYYFIEMNTRIQVEHPITEMVTGVDIVREQIQTAFGKKLSIRQNEIVTKGVAIECRIIAEDVDANFKPSPGIINDLRFPCGEGIRVESAVHNNSVVSPWYDSMVAKLIVHAPSRTEAVRKMKLALYETKIQGIATNIPLLKEIMDDKEYNAGKFDTSYVEAFLERRSNETDWLGEHK